MEIAINYWSVFVAAVAAFILGALWYSPLLFGKVWMRLTKVTSEDMANAKTKSMATSYIVNFLATFVMASVFAWILTSLGNLSLSAGLQGAFWLWLGFIATTFLGGVLWEREPLKLYFINAGYYLAALLLIGAILGS